MNLPRLVFLFGLLMLMSAGPLRADVSSIEGTLKSVDVKAHSITVSSGNGTITLDVATRAKITIDGIDGSLSELQPGIKARVSYYEQLGFVIAISVGTEQNNANNSATHSGTFIGSNSGKRTITVGMNLNGKQMIREFEVIPSAAVLLNGSPSSIANLEAGQAVDLQLFPNGAIGGIKARQGSLKFAPLFDGKTLDGWEGDKGLWTVSNGVMVGTGPKEPADFESYLSTSKTFGNFILKVQFRSEGDSGVSFRGRKNVQGMQVLTGSWRYGYLMDDLQEIVTDMDPRMNRTLESTRSSKGWRELKLSVVGEHVVGHLEGIRAIDTVVGEPSSGHISLKLRANTLFRIRKIEIANLSDVEDPSKE